METITKLIVPGGAFLLTLASGIWLGNAGKPLNAAIFNLHKLIALAAVVLAALQVVHAFKDAQPSALLLILVVVAGLCVLALFATGALMSIGKVDYAAMQVVHRVVSILVAAALVTLFYLLGGRKG